MHIRKGLRGSIVLWCLLFSTIFTAQAQLLWTVGLDDNGNPFNETTPGDGGGPNATFVQENGVINPLPGVPDSPELDRQADNDYYFAGVYTTVIASVTARPENGDYTPIGEVAADEEAVERAFAADDLDLRFHFNLQSNLGPTNLLTVTFDADSLDTRFTDPRF